MATKILRVTLADILEEVGAGHGVTGEVWARYSREVRLTTGELVVLASRRQPVPESGVVDFEVVPNDDATVNGDDQGFGIVVGWDLTYRGEHGQRVHLREAGRTVAVTSASPSPVQFSTLSPAVPIDPLVSYPTESEVDAKIAAAPFLTEADASSTYETQAAAAAAQAALVDGSTSLPYVPRVSIDLPNPFYFTHRGQPGPENTMEAFRTAIAADPSRLLETDIRELADGTLVLMHDATVDRTTDGTGNVADFTAPSWAALDATDTYPWPVRCAAPTWNEFVSEFGGKAIISPQVEPGVDRAKVLASVDPLKLQGSILWQATTLAEVADYKAAGYRVFFWWGASITSPSVASVVAAGADVLGIATTQPDADVSTLVATGLPVVVYTVSRRTERDKYLALGVQGFMSDEHIYQSRDTALATIDSWRYGVLGHGFIVNATSPDMTKVTIASGAVTLAQQTVLNAIPGEVCPIADAAGSYVIDVDLGFGTLPASGGSVIVLFGLPDDKNRSLVNAAAFPNGYLLLLRATGVMSLYKLTDGSSSATQIGSNATTAALTAGGFAHLTITVTPTQVTAARTDSAGTIGPVTDSTHRGGYIALGKKDVTDGTVAFKNLAIT